MPRRRDRRAIASNRRGFAAGPPRRRQYGPAMPALLPAAPLARSPPAGAGGVAPFIPCAGEVQDNVISFVFAQETQNLDYLCWAAAQETSHVFGLDHELNAKDPMTYLSPPVKKVGFMNEASNCGEYQPR